MNAYFDWLDRWMLGTGSSDWFASEQRHFEASGTHVLGFVYVDHTHGVTMQVESFCRVDSAGTVHLTSGPRQQNAALLVRYDLLAAMNLARVSESERQRLGLPVTPEWLSIYRHEEAEPLRRLALLHPLRAEGYPDDIKFVLPADEETRPEVVWGRLERALGEHYFECELLSEPQQDAGVHAGERVVVSVREVPDGVSPVCLGPPSQFLEE